MKMVKFTIDEISYDAFATLCQIHDITIKKQLSLLIDQDHTTTTDSNIKEYTPEYDEDSRRVITLKVNEDFYQAVTQKADQLELKVGKYLPYLIYKFISE